MAHLRKRYLSGVLKKALGTSPIVGIMGQRQTGKTTFTEGIAGEYFTLDNEESLELALKSPSIFIRNRKAPFVIDECQQSPPLFSALKDHVRLNPKPNQFLLTGSVRFTSIEEIKESLTGRMIALEMLPLSLSELHSFSLFSLSNLFQSKKLIGFLSKRHQECHFKSKHISEFLLKGGLPGIAFIKNDALRIAKFRSHIKTILDRDLRIVTKTSLDYLTLKTFLEEIALQQGEVFDLSKAARGARIALNSARKILNGLESVYMVRTILKQGTTQGKIIYFEDQGMASFLIQERGFQLTKPRVNDLNRFLFQQIHTQVAYEDKIQINLSSFRLKSGVIIDFVLSTQGKKIGFSVGIGDVASSHQIKSAQSFLKKHPNSIVLLLHQGELFRQINEQMFEVPISSVI